MKLKYLVTVATASIISLGFVSIPQNFNTAIAYPCAGANPCASADPCASANPCAGADPCAAAADSAPPVYTESASGLAIRGTDPVAYFTEGKFDL